MDDIGNQSFSDFTDSSYWYQLFIIRRDMENGFTDFTDFISSPKKITRREKESSFSALSDFTDFTDLS